MTLAILSWHSHKTLINVLESYRKYGLDILEDDKVIFFQEYSKEDRAIARDYGYTSFGSSSNIGIAEAYKLLVAYASDDIFLFLENDWELIEQPDEILYQGQQLLKANLMDVIRLRHRINPGEPLWSRQFKGHEMDFPQHLLDSVYWSRNPELLGPINFDYYWWYDTTAAYANWTNNPTMFRTAWLREHIVSRMSGDIEKDLQPWWAQQTFRVAQGTKGLFMHNRID